MRCRTLSIGRRRIRCGEAGRGEAPGCGVGFWGNKGFTPDLVDGLLQETARDSQHANLAPSAMVDAAETARQGIDLYGEQGRRIVAALEFHLKWEISYNHFHDLLGMKLPKMEAVLAGIRPTGITIA